MKPKMASRTAMKTMLSMSPIGGASVAIVWLTVVVRSMVVRAVVV